MNEKIIGWIAIAIILGAIGWIHKNAPFTPGQMQVLIVFILGFGIVLRAVALRTSRRTVMKRRRMFKEFWRRGERGDTALDLPEEESIVLLGRIKGGKPTALVMIAGAIMALYFGKNLMGLVLALGQAFLAGKLYFIARNLDKTLAPDAERGLPNIPVAEGDAIKYVLDINVQAVHDFIAPRAALPFWSVADAENWLAKCGFRRTGDRRWECQKNALRYLDADEIRSIEPCSDG